jgi:hypothetical protein
MSTVKKILMSVTGTLIIGVMAMKLNHNSSSASNILRVAFPYAKSANAYEPSRIYLGPEYVFLENVFSPLVEINPKNGQIEAGVAESFYWIGNDLHLVIRKDLRTVRGTLITARDAEFSLKRLVTMPGNTHGDFKDLICGTENTTSVEQLCSGIHAEGQELILKTTASGKTFLVPMLAAIDFAVIPKSSVDPKTLQIVDWENTSGPYYVAKDSAEGKIELRANPNHYHYSEKIPQVIELIPTDLKRSKGSLEDFSAGKVDFITTIDAVRADDVIAFSRGRSDATLHTTMNIRSFILTFTHRGLKELSSPQRFEIGRAIRQELTKSLAGVNGFEASLQFFPAFGEGALDKETLTRIQGLYPDSKEQIPDHLKAALVRLGDASKFVAAVKSAFPSVDVEEVQKNPNFVKYATIDEEPHFILSGPDTGFLEDISLISYSMNAGYFGMTPEERKQWIHSYMAEPSKETRLDRLKKIHEITLSSPVVVPLLVAPYAALARNTWKINLSQLYANNQLWLLEKI